MTDVAIDEFIANLPTPQQHVVRYVRELLHRAAPLMRERIRYQVPFFRCSVWFCYINPLKVGVEVCFLRGNELPNTHGLLEAHKRKAIRGLLLSDLDDARNKEEVLLEIIQEALPLLEKEENKNAQT